MRVTPGIKRLLEKRAEQCHMQLASFAREVIEAALAAEYGQLQQKEEVA